MQLGNLSCCGIKEIIGCHGWNNNRDSFYHLLMGYQGLLPCAWVVVDGVRMHEYVANFAAFVEENKLGTIITLPPAINPNSSNTLDVRMWQVDRLALQNWFSNHGPCKCVTCERATIEKARLQELINQQLAAQRLAAPGAPGVRVNSF